MGTRLATAWVQFGRALGASASERAAKHQALLMEIANVEYLVRPSVFHTT
jgi:hypothetical protein